MRKQLKSKTGDLEIVAESLKTEALKIRAIAHLIENQAESRAVPVDLSDINAGVGIVLNECASNLMKASDQLSRPAPLRALESDELGCQNIDDAPLSG